MIHELVGGYFILGHMPIWAMAIVLYYVMIGVLFIGRYVFEGFDYNISWSSQQGDVALIGIILIGMTVMQAGVDVSASFYHTANQLALVAGFGYMIIWLVLYIFAGRKDTLMDGYHNIVIVPLFLWLLVLTIPVIFDAGSLFEKSSVVFFGFVWVLAFVYDANTGRLQQRFYLAGQGVRPYSIKWLKWFKG